MPPYSAYIICGTPRSGSTLLCEMLAASGVAGRPNSYFRQQDIGYWADRWGVEHPDGVETAEFDRAYLAAMLDAGRDGTDIFGLRLMAASVADAVRRLDRVAGDEGNVAQRFAEAFGPVLYIHLSRGDTVAQAVSLVRAEQSGLWHLAADGSVMEGADDLRPMVYDGDRIATLVRELTSDNAAWGAFFAAHNIAPLRLTYESVTADPQAALATALGALGQDPKIAKTVAVPTAKMASGTSRQWAEKFRSERSSGL